MSTFTKIQQEAFDSYIQGNNFCITGPGGCGKSFFIQHIYKHAISNGKNIKVTSLTGCSAILLNCNATTIHKWGCLGLGKGEEEQIYSKIVKMKKHANYIETDVLIIDEVSMLNQKLFEVLDYLCKRFRKEMNKPFGGLQIIVSGDFYQLPPVCIDKTNIAESNFCFESSLWNTTFSNCYLFNENFRQHEDPEYFNMLQEIRSGKLSFDTVEQLILCSHKKIDINDPIQPTKIFPIRKTVEQLNKEELSKLKTKQYTFHCEVYHNNTKMINIDSISDKPLKTEIDYLKKNSMFENELTLSIGCQVMCISNLDPSIKLVNGSQGVIIDFEYSVEENDYFPLIQFEFIEKPIQIKRNSWYVESNDHYTIQQLPLILSWAITTHKSQGLSIEKALIDIGNNIFEYGQTYVALSRVKSLSGLYLTKVNTKKIRAHPKVVRFYNELNV